MGHKTTNPCKVYRNPKAMKACKQHKPQSKVNCIETSPPQKKKKCIFDPSKVSGNKGSKWRGKTSKTQKIITVGGIVAIVMAILFVYTLIKGMGFAQSNKEQLQQLAPLLLA